MINSILKLSIVLLQSDASSIKIYGAMIATALTFIADASSTFSQYEEYGLRAFGGACIGYLIIELRNAQKTAREKDIEHKKEIKDMWAEHKQEILDRAEKHEDAIQARAEKTEALITRHSEIMEKTVEQHAALAQSLSIYAKFAIEQTIPRPKLPG